MRHSPLVLYLGVAICSCSTSGCATLQRWFNHAPEITGQRELSMQGGSSLQLRLDHLAVEDPDDKYPDGFTLQVKDGENYQRSGSRISPTDGFAGDLVVALSVFDGTESSDAFHAIVTVLAKQPERAEQQKNVASPRAEPLVASDSLRKVSKKDPSASRPPSARSDPLRLEREPAPVSSRKLRSEVVVQKSVSEPSAAPTIVRQKRGLVAALGNSKGIEFSDIEVEDEDSSYPEDFTLEVMQGVGYSVDGTSITPSEEAAAALAVPVRVFDGENWSLPHELCVSVLGVGAGRPIGREGMGIELGGGGGYSVRHGLLIPDLGFVGTLEVPVRVTMDSSSQKAPIIVGDLELELPQLAALRLGPNRLEVEESRCAPESHLSEASDAPGGKAMLASNQGTITVHISPLDAEAPAFYSFEVKPKQLPLLQRGRAVLTVSRKLDDLQDMATELLIEEVAVIPDQLSAEITGFGFEFEPDKPKPKNLTITPQPTWEWDFSPIDSQADRLEIHMTATYPEGETSDVVAREMVRVLPAAPWWIRAWDAIYENYVVPLLVAAILGAVEFFRRRTRRVEEAST